MNTRSHFAAFSAALLGIAALNAAPAAQAQTAYNYSYSVGTYTLSGQFVTNAASGLITEADALSNAYTVSNGGVKQFSVSFAGGAATTGTLTNFTGVGKPSGTYPGVDDFAYTIGSSQFSQTNPAQVDPAFPLDLTLDTGGGTFYGLAYGSAVNLFSLDQNSNIVAAGPQASVGFASGPLVTAAATPEPGAIAFLAGMGVFGAGLLARRRK